MSFWQSLIAAVSSLSASAYNVLWSLLAPVMGGRGISSLWITKPSQLLTGVPPAADSAASPSSPAIASKPLFPSGKVQSLSSTAPRPGFPVACSTDGLFGIVQVRNPTGTVVGWDFDSGLQNNHQHLPFASPPLWSHPDSTLAQHIPEHIPDQHLSELENLGHVESPTSSPEELSRSFGQSKLVMRRSRQSTSFPYSLNDRRGSTAHRASHLPSPEDVYNQLGGEFEVPFGDNTRRSDSINSAGSNVYVNSQPATIYAEAEFSPPELEGLQSPDDNAISASFEELTALPPQGISLSVEPHSEPTHGIFPLNLQMGAVAPVIQEPIAGPNFMVNGVYPLVHSAANSDNGSPENVSSLYDDKHAESELTWSGLMNVPTFGMANSAGSHLSYHSSDEELGMPSDFHHHMSPQGNSAGMTVLSVPEPASFDQHMQPLAHQHMQHQQTHMVPAVYGIYGNHEVVVSPQSSVLSVHGVDMGSNMGSNSTSPVSVGAHSSTPSPGLSDGLGEPFVCTSCDASFRVKGYLTRHMKKHAEQKAYTCPFYCADSEPPCHPSGGFSRRDTYKMHLKARHFMYPSGTRSEDRSKVAGSCGGCGVGFDSNEAWVEEHIHKDQCPALANGVRRTSDVVPKDEFDSAPLLAIASRFEVLV